MGFIEDTAARQVAAAELRRQVAEAAAAAMSLPGHMVVAVPDPPADPNEGKVLSYE